MGDTFLLVKQIKDWTLQNKCAISEAYGVSSQRGMDFFQKRQKNARSFFVRG